MQVYDEATGKLTDMQECRRVLVDIVGNILVFGYSSQYTNIMVDTRGTAICYDAYLPTLRNKVSYNRALGRYCTAKIEYPLIFGKGGFPYSFTREYEAVSHFDLFQGKQTVLKYKKHRHQLSYTFGLEFETSGGYIPQDLIFRDGLIPLRDGSIRGLEYSTVILSGNEGLSLLEQAVKTLKEYTIFDKNCSLHIHFGNYPLEPDKIFNLYMVCHALEEYLSELLPEYTFRTSYYKSTGKDYCQYLPEWHNFNSMYRELVGQPYFGNLMQPHPNDLDRTSKWNIDGRYYFVNFINLLCYNVNKTVEFRFLRPTYNFKKILLWIYIFNAILKYSENMMSPVSDLKTIVRAVYPDSSQIITGIDRLRQLTACQTSNGDMIGEQTFFEKQLFNQDLKL